jgi:hypothetical protein
MGYVYVIGNGRGFYKIGQTNGPVHKRLSMLQIGSPDDLAITHVEPHANPAELERELHRQFSSKRKRGEWFELDQNDIATIAKGRPNATTWDRLVELEPDLESWLAIAKGRWKKIQGVEEDYCSVAAWYGFIEEEKYRVRLPISGKRSYGLKQVICELVGWDVKHRGGNPELASPLAYDIAYETVFDALPPCRGRCGCSE